MPPLAIMPVLRFDPAAVAECISPLPPLEHTTLYENHNCSTSSTKVLYQIATHHYDNGVFEMKWGRVIIICAIVLSIQIASADTLNLTAGTYETFADNRTVQITANLTDSTGYPVNGTRVNFTTDLGNLSASYNYTNASGIATVNISSWDIGNATITAEAPTATNATVNMTFVVGPVSKIVLTSILEGTVNTTHLITATVYDKTAWEFANDENKWRIMPDVKLNFTITPPPGSTYNSANITPPSNTTNKSGITTAIVRLDKCAGTNGINVNVTNEDGVDVHESKTIIGVAGAPVNLSITANPYNVSANGIDTSQITGKVTDVFLNPIISTGSVRFNTSGNIITKPLDGTGEAAISIGPSIFTVNVTVNGTYLDEVGNSTNLTNETVVVFYTEEPARIVVTADATRISTTDIPGVNESAITAAVIDRWGHVLSNRSVNFSTTLGDLSSTTAITDANGQATTTLHSDITGDATVTASTLNDSGYEINGTIVIRIMNESFVSVITNIEPDPVEPGGIINVTTVISGQGNITGTRLAAHAMLALDRSGSMDPDYYAGTPLDVVLVLDRSGSMKFLGSGPEQPMTDAKTAAKVFMDNLVSNAQVGVVSFSSSSRIDTGLTLLHSSDNKTLVRGAIDGIYASGSTAIGDGLADANSMLVNGRGDARKITVLLTDGVCNAGSDRDCSNAIAIANANHITIYTIGLGSAEYIDEPLLQRIASETGGTYYNAPSSSELRAVYN
ncbi:hypothetical protein DRN77_04915 [Methanosarcinales archaeon]|nr:MAG: hypothetical protein DRN77_04915 [Methanosarcinales archaeon]